MKTKLLTILTLLVLCVTGALADATEICYVDFSGLTIDSDHKSGSKDGTNCSMTYAVDGSTTTFSDVVYVKFGSSSNVKITYTGDEYGFAAGDIVTVALGNQNSKQKNIGFKLKDNENGNGTSGNVAASTTTTMSYTLTDADINSDGTISIYRGGSNSSDTRYYSFSVARENDGKINSGIEYATTSVTKSIGDDNFTNPLTNPHGLTVAYSITTNGTGSSINATTGEVTVGNASGTETVTATFDGDATYRAKTASYTLTVQATGLTTVTDKFWKFSDAAWNNVGTISQNTIVDNMQIVADGSNTASVSSASATIDGVSFTKAIAFGQVKETGRQFHIKVAGGSLVSVYAKAGGNGRKIKVAKGTYNGTIVGTEQEVSSSGGVYTFNYTDAEDGDLYIYNSGSNGLNFHGIKVEALSPELSVAETPEAFSYIVGNGPSAEQSFTVTGTNLTDGISATLAGTNASAFEIQTGDGEWGAGPLAPISGNAVKVRLKSGQALGSYNATLTFASTGASDVVLNLSGSVTNQVYTVTYNLNGGDGDAPTEDPQEAGAPITLPAAPTRDFYTFAGWLCSADGLVKTAGSSYTMTAANTTFTAQWTNPQYASSLDFTAVTLGGLTGSTDISDFLASANMVASNLGTGSGWDAQTAANKYGFWGYKLKNSGATVKFLVKAGKRVSIILGSVGDDATLKKGDASSTISKKKGDAEETVIPSFVAAEDMVVSITTGSAQSVTLKRIFIADEATSVSGTISASGWSTFSSEYPLDLSTISGGAAYYAKSTSGNNVTVTSTTDKVIAGEGLMIHGTPNAEFTINVDAAATAAISDNLLRGVPVGGTVKSADHNYVFAWPSATPADYGFYLVNSTAPVMTAGKSFLHLGADLSNEAAFLSMIFDDGETTNIKLNVNDSLDSDAAMYNLAGQKVSESYKGIVIVNGKKMIRK